MEAVTFKSLAGKFAKSHPTADSTDTAFTSVATTTRTPPTQVGGPAGAGYVPVGKDGPTAPNVVTILVGGTDANNEVYDMRVYGLNRLGDEYIHEFLLEVNCILSTYTGVAGGLTTSFRFADTITITTSNGNGIGVAVTSPGNNTPAAIRLDVGGAEWLAFYFDRTPTTGGGLGANALVRPL